MRIPLLNGMGYGNMRVSEIWMCQLLNKIIPGRNGCFIDVGVNLGQTLLKLRSVAPSMDYIGFEPNPKCTYYCNALIEANQFKNCRLLPVGLFDKDTVLALNLYSEGGTDPAASVIDNFRPEQKVYQKLYVPVSRFEQMYGLLGITSIAIIKIDVEGAEMEVLESMRPAITRHRPVLLMEILPCHTPDNIFRISRQEKIELMFKELDYQIIRIIKKNNGESIERLEPIETIGVHSNMELCEYVLVPKEMRNEALSWI